MFKFNFNITQRVAIGYFVILFVISITSIVSILLIGSNKRKYSEVSKVYVPTVNFLKECESLNIESHFLITEWIYISDSSQKTKLRNIHNVAYPKFKKGIDDFSGMSDNPELHERIHQLMRGIDSSVVSQELIMTKLGSMMDYANDSLVDLALKTYKNQVVPQYERNQKLLASIMGTEVNFLKSQEAKVNDSFNYLMYISFVLLATIIIVGLSASYFATKSITNPIHELKSIIEVLSRGEIPVMKLTDRKDEIGDMALAIQSMADNIKKKMAFAKETGAGIYDANFELLSDKDVLGNALIQMRNNLKKAFEEELGRNWINSGLAQVGEIIQEGHDNSDKFYEHLLFYLARYMNAGHGALYITVDDEQTGKEYLELKASYAFDAEKAGKKRIALGEGLAGQAALDKRFICINDIPESYIKINTGLGEAQPKNIVLVPLVFDAQLRGLIELATLTAMNKLEIEFIEKISRNIAITFDVDKRKAHTEKLLDEAQKLNIELQNNKTQLTTANEELRTFIYRASHDLRGPLTTIMGLVSLVQEDPTDVSNAEYIQSIAEPAHKLDNTLRALIKIMGIRGSMVKKSVIDVKDKVNAVVQELKGVHDTERMRIVQTVNITNEFVSDKEILGYVLQNTIENAIIYRNSGTDAFVRINVTDYQEGIKITVTDNGIGIKNSVKGKIFDMFYKGTERSTGLGLGLYFVKNAVVKLNGVVGFESTEGEGTTIQIYLPSLAAQKDGEA